MTEASHKQLAQKKSECDAWIEERKEGVTAIELFNGTFPLAPMWCGIRGGMPVIIRYRNPEFEVTQGKATWVVATRRDQLSPSLQRRFQGRCAWGSWELASKLSHWDSIKEWRKIK